MKITFRKCDPLVDGTNTIICKGEEITVEDRVYFTRLWGKPIKIIEEGEIPTIDKTILLEQIYQLQVEIMDKIAEMQTPDVGGVGGVVGPTMPESLEQTKENL